MFLATTFIGYNEIIALSNAMISINDQQQIGAAGGAATAGRASIAAVCQTVYNVILSNRLLQTVPAHVIPAVTAAGLPEASVPSFLAALKAGTAKAFSAVPGLTPEIRAIGVSANQFAYGDAYKTVWLSSLGFTGLGIIMSVLSPNTDKLMSGRVAATLGRRKLRTSNA